MVTSSNHPGFYPNNLEKTETIQVEQGLILSLQFTAFDIEDGGLSCLYDHLKITDGDGTTLMEKSCGGPSSDGGNIVIGGQSIGSSLPPTIQSKSNVVHLVFTANGYIGTFTGWSLNWNAGTPGV